MHPLRRAARDQGTAHANTARSGLGDAAHEWPDDRAAAFYRLAHAGVHALLAIASHLDAIERAGDERPPPGRAQR